MPIEVNDIVRGAAKILLVSGDYAMNVFWYKLTGTGSADEADVFDAVVANLKALYNLISAQMKAGTTFPEVVVDHVAWEETPPPPGWKVQQTLGIGEWSPTIPPAAAGDPLPFQDAPCIRMVPVLRKHQGRKYLPAFTETHNTATGYIDPLLMMDLADFGAQMVLLTTVPNSALFLRMVIPNMTGPATLEFNQTIIGNVWRTQRRRQRGVGF